MELVKETFVGFLLGITVYAIVVELFGVFFSGDPLSYTLGLVIGVIAAILIFMHMAWTLNKALDYPEDGATKYVRKNTLLRLLAMTIVMVPGLIFPEIRFLSLVLGLLGLKIGALIAPFFLRRLYPEHFVTDEETLSIVLPDEDEEAQDDIYQESHDKSRDDKQ